jgi:hypothetical protein
LGLKIASHPHRASTTKTTKKNEANLQKQFRYYQSLFGCSPDVTAEIWYRLAPREVGETSLVKGAEPQHLLWALLFMKLYANQDALCSMVGGVDDKTFSFWSRYFIKEMSRKLFHLEVRSNCCSSILCIVH